MRRIEDNPFYHYRAPRRPAIKKRGTIRCDTVETTPLVFKDTLYRFESVRPHSQNPANPEESAYFRLVEARSGHPGKSFGTAHHLGSAFAEENRVLVSGVKGIWGGDTVTVFRSEDLERWDETDAVFPGMRCFNTCLCRKDGRYVMLIECDEGVPFTFRFAVSADLTRWELLPEEYVFQKDRYAGGPAIYTFPGDPHYYVLYLEAYPGPCYATCVARSADLREWEYSPLNPVLMYGDEDKQIADPLLTPGERARIDRALNINNSDMELCGYKGRTVIYYSWGCQRGIEFLAEAVFEGTPRELLQGFFGERPPA